MKGSELKQLLRQELRSRPGLYDLTVRARRAAGWRNPIYRFLDCFSKLLDRRVRFVQIGAGDGLRSDPVREFIVRDEWTGILVEPLPSEFLSLQRNYQGIKAGKLVFVNAVVTAVTCPEVSLYTFDEAFLATLSPEERLDFLRKSSLDVKHVHAFCGSDVDPAAIIKEIKAPSLTVSELLADNGQSADLDLLAIDAEGHEGSILRSIDYDALAPTAILFESHHLGSDAASLSDFLERVGYLVFGLGGDSVAVTRRFFNSRPQELKRALEDATIVNAAVQARSAH